MSDFALVIQARMDSSRLPGKVLLPFGKSTVLGFLLNRLRAHFKDAVIIVATSTNTKDQQIVDYCNDLRVRVICGDETNVLSRYIKVARECNTKHLVRLTSDNPLISTELIERCVEKHQLTGAELTSTRHISDDLSIHRVSPKGMSVDVIKVSALMALENLNLKPYEYEHVIPYFFFHRRPVAVLTKDEISDLKFDRATYSIDTREDYAEMFSYAKKLGLE
jgi:spore coat polysaccharide biosynthesis protein SpsF